LNFQKKISHGNIERWIYEEKGELDKIISAVTIFWKQEKLLAIEFYSSLCGIAKWNSESKKLSIKTWEEEEIAQSLSYLNYHYTGKMLNSSDYIVENSIIVEDCLKKIQDPVIVKYIQELMKKC